MNTSKRRHASRIAGEAPFRIFAIVTGLTLAACNGTVDEAQISPAATDTTEGPAAHSMTAAPSTSATASSGSSVASSLATGTTTTPTTTASSSAATAQADYEFLRLPVPGLAFDVDSEIRVAGDLRQLTAESGLMFAFRPPDTLLRIDPVADEITLLELGIGPTNGGASWVVAGDTIWLIGGAFRDQLIEIDTTTMTEVGRTDLGEDHAVAAANADEVWLTTLDAVRRFDVTAGTLDPPIGLDVDPRNLTIDPDGQVWVSLPIAAQVARIDPTTNHVDTFDVAPGPGWIDADHGVVWVSHTPIASVSRLDPATGETIEVIDLDLSLGTVASAQTGALQTTIDGTWVYVSFPGSRFRDALALVDPSGTVIGARMIPFDSHTWEAVDGGIWLHRLAAGTIIRSALDDLVAAPPTDEDRLLPVSPSPDTTATGTAAITADEVELLTRLDQVLDPATSAADLGIADQAHIRDGLIELAAAQAELHVEPVSVTIDDLIATTVFDVLIEGDTVILPAVELDWHRADNERTWHLDATTFCRLATGVGITGCTP